MNNTATSNTPWPTVKLGDVCEVISVRGHQIKQNEIKATGIYPVVSQSENKIEGYSDLPIAISDVPLILFGDHTCCIKLIDFPFIVGADGTKLLRPIAMTLLYMFYCLQNVREKLCDGKYRRHFSDLMSATIPLPPLEVQREIVAKVEKGLEEADVLAAHFKRLAVLADETFKAELDETFQSLSAPTVPRVYLGELGEMKRGSGIKKAEVLPEGRPCVRYGEIYTSFNYILDVPKSFVCDEIYEKSVHIKSGDLIFTLTGENREEIGKVLAYLEEEEVAAGGDLAVWSNHGCNSKYLTYLMYSSPLIHEKAMASNGQIIVHLSVKKMQQISIPLPPLAEQERIVEKLEAVKVRCERLKAEAERGLKAAEALRKAVLAEAFEQ